MSSKLIITSIEKLQEKVEETVKSLEDSIGIYVSLNKNQKSVEENFKKNNIKTEKIFFIDCVTEIKTREDVLHVSPSDLERLSFSIKEFTKKIKGEKYLIIDALSTLLIYSPENKVAAFVKELSQLSSEKLKFIAFSPKTKGEELLEKIFNFFEEVEK